MELLALLLLLPMTWSNSDVGSNTQLVTASATMAPQIDSKGGRLTISPPSDRNLSMVVLEHRTKAAGAEASRSIASVDEPSRTDRIIEVIVTAP